MRYLIFPSEAIWLDKLKPVEKEDLPRADHVANGVISYDKRKDKWLICRRQSYPSAFLKDIWLSMDPVYIPSEYKAYVLLLT